MAGKEENLKDKIIDMCVDLERKGNKEEELFNLYPLVFCLWGMEAPEKIEEIAKKARE